MSNVQKVISILENAPRLGAETDEPEGTRYIQISETLASLMIRHLKRVEADRVDALRYALELDRQWQTGTLISN